MLRTRKYFLEDSCQPRLLAVSLVHYLLIILTFVATLFVPLFIEMDNIPLPFPEKGELEHQLSSLHERVWPSVIGVFVLLAIHSVLFSHRIAGPLYRYRTIFKAIGEGDLTVSAHTRKHDYVKKESESLNEMITSLRSSIKDLEERCGHACGVLAELKRAVETESRKDVDQTLGRLEEQLERLNSSLHKFRT